MKLTGKMSFRIILLSVMVAGFSCKKETIQPTSAAVTITLDHVIDDQSLEMDSVRYFNAANNNYSVTKLRYYLSDFTFINQSGEEYKSGHIQYVDTEDETTLVFKIDELPKGNYTRVSFFVGLDDVNNETGALPGTTENVNMAWPDPMGGGYHFMKLEGHFIDDVGSTSGYAVHMGTATALTSVELEEAMNFEFKNHRMTLTMNVNEWFDTPSVFDFNDGNYTMGKDSLMSVISANGMDAFSLEYHY